MPADDLELRMTGNNTIIASVIDATGKVTGRLKDVKHALVYTEDSVVYLFETRETLPYADGIIYFYRIDKNGGYAGVVTKFYKWNSNSPFATIGGNLCFSYRHEYAAPWRKTQLLSSNRITKIEII